MLATLKGGLKNQLVRSYTGQVLPINAQFRCALTLDTTNVRIGPQALVGTQNHSGQSGFQLQAASILSSTGDANGDGFTLDRDHLVAMVLESPSDQVLASLQVYFNVGHAAAPTTTPGTFLNPGAGQPCPAGRFVLTGRIPSSLANVTGCTWVVGEALPGHLIRVHGVWILRSRQDAPGCAWLSMDDIYELRGRRRGYGPIQHRGLQANMAVITDYWRSTNTGESSYSTAEQTQHMGNDGCLLLPHDKQEMHAGPTFANNKTHVARKSYWRNAHRAMARRGLVHGLKAMTYPINLGSGVNVTAADIRDYQEMFSTILIGQPRSPREPAVSPTIRLTGLTGVSGTWVRGQPVIGTQSGYRAKFSHFNAAGTIMFCYDIAPFVESTGAQFTAGEQVRNADSGPDAFATVGASEASAFSLGQTCIAERVTSIGAVLLFDINPLPDPRFLCRHLVDYTGVSAVNTSINTGGAAYTQATRRLVLTGRFTGYTHAAGDRLILPRGGNFSGLPEVGIAAKISNDEIELSANVAVGNTNGVDAFGIIAADGTVKVANLNLCDATYTPGTRTIAKTGAFTGVNANDWVYIEMTSTGHRPGWAQVASATANSIVLAAGGYHLAVNPNTLGASSDVRILGVATTTEGLRGVTRAGLHLAADMRAFVGVLVHQILDDGTAYNGTHMKQADWNATLDYMVALIKLGRLEHTTVQEVMAQAGLSVGGPVIHKAELVLPEMNA